MSMSEHERGLLGLGGGVRSTSVVLVQTYKAILKIHDSTHCVTHKIPVTQNFDIGHVQILIP